MIVLARPAPLEALARMRGSAQKSLGPAEGPFAYAAAHAAKTRSWGAWIVPAAEDWQPEPRCVACGGLFAHDDGRLEAWFACLPEAAGEIGAILRAARLTLAAIADAEGVEIFARVRVGWRPGARIARVLSMRRTGEEAGYEIWSLGA